MSDPFFIPQSKIKSAGATKAFTIDFKALLRSYWIAGRSYIANDTVRSASVTGFAFQAQANGEAGATEPAWPRALNGTVLDGSISWKAITPSGNAVDAISSVAWSQVNPPDAALTISGPAFTTEESTATFAGGTSGQTYRIQCAATTAGGKVYPAQFDLEIN